MLFGLLNGSLSLLNRLVFLLITSLLLLRSFLSLTSLVLSSVIGYLLCCYLLFLGCFLLFLTILISILSPILSSILITVSLSPVVIVFRTVLRSLFIFSCCRWWQYLRHLLRLLFLDSSTCDLSSFASFTNFFVFKDLL